MDDRAIGEALGFPTCCVDAFVADGRGGGQARKRGAIVTTRSNDEIKEAHEICQRVISKAKFYVPCEECMGGPNWHPYGQILPAIVEAGGE